MHFRFVDAFVQILFYQVCEAFIHHDDIICRNRIEAGLSKPKKNSNRNMVFSKNDRMAFKAATNWFLTVLGETPFRAAISGMDKCCSRLMRYTCCWTGGSEAMTRAMSAP